MKAVFLDRGSFSDTVQFHLPDSLTSYEEFQTTQPEETISRIRESDVIITNKIVLNEHILSHASRVKYILVLATGTNNIDHNYCKKHNIQVDNIEGYSTETVPEHTFAMLLALKRNLLPYHQAMQAGKWSQSDHFCLRDFPLSDLAGSNMVLIGSGSLGQAVANIAKAFNMKVTFAERKGATNTRDGYLAFEEAIQLADVISLHCPLTPETENMIAEPEFKLMKQSCILINTGRGGLVSEPALVEAIENQNIAGAGFDVVTVEPMPTNHVLQALTQHPNFLLTPHVAWSSDGAMQTLSNMAMEKLSTFIDNA